jgi:ArsR family transcriptional regulator
MESLVRLLKSVSDRNRLRIVAALSDCSELCACQITEFLEVAGATVSRHLQLLQQADLIESRKEGRWVYYRLKTASADREAILAWLQGELVKCADIRRDRKKLRKITAIDTEELCRRQRGEKCCPR